MHSIVEDLPLLLGHAEQERMRETLGEPAFNKCLLVTSTSDRCHSFGSPARTNKRTNERMDGCMDGWMANERGRDTMTNAKTTDRQKMA